MAAYDDCSLICGCVCRKNLGAGCLASVFTAASSDIDSTTNVATVIVPAGVGADAASGNKPYAIAATLRTQVPAVSS